LKNYQWYWTQRDQLIEKYASQCLVLRAKSVVNVAPTLSLCRSFSNVTLGDICLCVGDEFRRAADEEF